MAIRLGAVSFLNARPLVRGLDRDPDRFLIRFDLPNRCAALLHERAIDVGLIPSIEFLSGNYRIVPGIGIVSHGPVASVALFARTDISEVTSIALDTSSRTSVALVRVLCARHFGIRPRFVPAAPDLEEMVRHADAALLIGDPALFADYRRLSLQKIDLGAAWSDMTRLPFVYAFWAGHPGALTTSGVQALQDARDLGCREAELVAHEFFPADPARQTAGTHYLRHHIGHTVGDLERAGLEKFFELAVSISAAPVSRPLEWYEEAPVLTRRV
jgi:chorismate dehydratase